MNKANFKFKNQIQKNEQLFVTFFLTSRKKKLWKMNFYQKMKIVGYE